MPFPPLRLGPDVKLVGLMVVIREKSTFAPILTCRPTLPFFVFIFQLTPTHSKSRRQLVEETIHLAPVPTAILHHSLDVNSHCLSQFIEQIICVIVVKATLHQQHLPKAQSRPRPSIAPSGVSLSHRILKPRTVMYSQSIFVRHHLQIPIHYARK